jgi:hypothetical protein
MLDSFCGGIMAAGAGRHRGSGFASVPLRAPPLTEATTARDWIKVKRTTR